MKEKLLKLQTEGKSYSEIAKIVNLSKSTISYYIGNRTGISKAIKEKRNCKNCEKEILSPKIFCDKNCAYAYKPKLRIKNLKSGNLATNDTIRLGLIEDKGNVCSICNIKNLWNKLPLTLHVDHVDGNSDNNSYNNLRLVCPNCHSQLETSKNTKLKKQTKRNKYLRLYKGYIEG